MKHTVGLLQVGMGMLCQSVQETIVTGAITSQGPRRHYEALQLNQPVNATKGLFSEMYSFVGKFVFSTRYVERAHLYPTKPRFISFPRLWSHLTLAQTMTWEAWRALVPVDADNFSKHRKIVCLHCHAPFFLLIHHLSCPAMFIDRSKS